MGQKLAFRLQQDPDSYTALQTIDSIVPVPNCSCLYAQSLSKGLGIKYNEYIKRNESVSRTFITKDTARSKTIEEKYTFDTDNLQGQNILLVDDSIVRGSTAKHVVNYLRTKCGVKTIFLVSCAPPIRYLNVYSINIKTYSELVAHNKTLQEIQDELGVDKLVYQTLEDTISCLHTPTKTCETSMFDGEYHIPTDAPPKPKPE